MADVRRTPARYATAALQNPLAPPRYGVFALKTFTSKRPCQENRNQQLKISRLTASAPNPLTEKRTSPNRKRSPVLLPRRRKRRSRPPRRNQPTRSRRR